VPTPGTLEARTALRTSGGAKQEHEERETPMSALKTVRAYGRYLVGAFAAVAFRVVGN
jgi:hypothetical protein